MTSTVASTTRAASTATRAARTIAVGMSGGVDSAVAALLLKRRGHDVVGVHMRNWDAAEEGSEEAGCAEQEQKDARRVCDTLGIGYREVDLSREYWHEVFEPFVRGYREGRTPNPDVACNRHIKFDHFARATRALGADGVATGHYARLRRREPGGAVELLTGADETKDQSYFLAAVEQSALRDALFPLGELRKTEVRALAAEAGLHVAAKRDSAGICFVGRRNFASFLANYVPAQPSGPFVCVDRGAAVGEHRGQAFYTPGQRARIGGQPQPWYVVAKDAETNTVFVCEGAAHPALLTQALLAAPVHWVAAAPPPALSGGGELRCEARVRHLQPLERCAVEAAGDDGAIRVQFDAPGVPSVAEGQAVALYDGEVCLGAGIIVAPERDALRASELTAWARIATTA